MPWFKVDDGLFSSRKVLMIPRSMRNVCMGAWVQAGAWSAKELTDGHVPGFVLEELGGIPEIRDELIRVGLWLSDGSDGILFHDWTCYQPTREQVETERSKSAERQRKWAENRGKTNGVNNAVSNAVTTGAPTRPDPTRPSTSKEVDKGHATRIPTPFTVTDAMASWFTSKGLTVNLELETEKFCNYFEAVAGDKGLKKDWVKTWNNWMLRAQSYQPANAALDPWAGKEHLGFAE